MAQHDYVIDNSTGANVRADINNALLAISSNNSGSSAPSTTYALQTFANTTSSTLQLRNAANNAFVDLRGFDGSIILPDGSNGSCSLSFSGDGDTGIFRSTTNTFNIATGGVERLELASTGTVFNEDGEDVDFRIEGDTEANLFYVDASTERIGMGTSSPAGTLHLVDDSNSNGSELFLQVNNNNTTDNLGAIHFGNNGDNTLTQLFSGTSGNNTSSYFTISTASTGTTTEALRVDSSQRVLIGTTTNTSTGVGSSSLQISGSGADTSGANLIRTGSNAGGSFLQFTKNRGSATQSGDTIGGLTFMGHDGTDVESYLGIIRCIASATATSNSMTGDITFETSDGSNVATERMRLQSTGHLGIGMTPSGVRLDVTSNVNDIARFTGPNTGGITIRNDTNHEIHLHSGSSDALAFGTNGENERMRINSGGTVMVNQTSSISNAAGTPIFQVSNSTADVMGIARTSNDGGGAFLTFTKTRGGNILQNDDRIGTISFHGHDGTDTNPYAAEIGCFVDNNSVAANQMPGRITFGTTGATSQTPTERMRIDHKGLIQMGTTSDDGSSRLSINPFVDSTTQRGIVISGRRDVYDVIAINFVHATTFASAGNIQFTSTAAVQYNTTSDYRLKQDVVTLSDSITRLKQLNPVHFKWKDMPSVEADGFLAHEVQAVVPSAITGEKDALDENGNIEPQQIEVGALTPLLTSALQEAVAKIEVLETKVAALEAA